MVVCHHARITALLATFGFNALASLTLIVSCALCILTYLKGAVPKMNFDKAPFK